MLQNYFRTAIRYFLRYRTYALINIGGFSAGLAISMFIIIWVIAEVRQDKFHDARPYRVFNNYTLSDGSVTTGYLTQSPLAKALADQIPEVDKAIRVSRSYESLIQVDVSSFNERGYFADPDFFGVFTFPLLYGNDHDPFPDIQSIAISRALAEKLFGKESAIGKTIRFDRQTDLTVSAVFADVPANSSMQFSYVVPFEQFLNDSPWLEGWNNNSILTYVTFKDGVEANPVRAKLNALYDQHCPTCDNDSFFYAYGDLHLYGRFENGVATGGRIDYVMLFGTVALVILLMSCVNFTILATAQASTRTKEVGVRKVMGATRQSLLRRFVGESVLLAMISLVIAFVIVLVLGPVFSEMTGQALRFERSPDTIIMFVGIALVVGIVAGSYPSLYLSGLFPVQILRGKGATGGRLGGLPRGLVVTQLAISSVMIIGSLIVHQQLNYIRSKDLGFRKDDIVSFTLSDSLMSNPEVLKQRIGSVPGVASVGFGNALPFNVTRFWNTLSWPGKPADSRSSVYVMGCDDGFIPTMEMTLLEGRNFQPNSQDANNFIINETAANMMGLDRPVGVVLRTQNTEGTIVGVVKDFHNDNLRSGINPMILTYAPQHRFVFVKIAPSSVPATLAALRSLSTEMDPGYPFDYQFVKDRFDNEYRIESTTGNLSIFFAFVATFISSIGLFGVVLFIAERRSREVGIRKVMGASVGSIVALLVRQFVPLVATSFLISIPTAYYILNNWLTAFTYRVDIGWMAFVLTGALSIIIALVTISYQTIKAATVNPVQTLRSE